MAFVNPAVSNGDYSQQNQGAYSGPNTAAHYNHRMVTPPPEADPDTEIQELARQFTNVSRATVPGSPFNFDHNPALDPNGEHFNARAWARAMYAARYSNDERLRPRTAGFSFNKLNVHGFSQPTDYQKSVGNLILAVPGMIQGALGRGQDKVEIVRNFAGVVQPGEMLVVLGPPGSGCTTFLKSIAGEMNGIVMDESSELNYQGISPKKMHTHFRGEAIYTAETDIHFPQLTVGQTLKFAALARTPRTTPEGVSKDFYAEHVRDVTMAMYGILEQKNTIVGNDFVRGVSGGQRKRVTIAEASLAGAPLQCWDNSTRGLDSANAVEFCKNLRLGADVNQTTACVAIYQAPQAAYDLFDKVLVIYKGYQIFFGRVGDAHAYFEGLGFQCPARQTTPDFLTSMTSPTERVPKPGMEKMVPMTPEEFSDRWLNSSHYQNLLTEIAEFNKAYPIKGAAYHDFVESRRLEQAKSQRPNSAYTISYGQQIRLCVRRSFWRVKADPSIQYAQIIGQAISTLVIASVFYNLQPTTASFFQRGALIFFAILMNAFASVLEILTLYAQRPIVEKHSRYAFYHPSAEAWASALADLPVKLAIAVVSNVILYFMTNLRREAGAFFFFFLITFTLTLCMSMFFRTVASLSRSLAQALAPVAIIILAIVIYTGFAIPITYMRGWSRWINYIDLVGYAFESLMVNEFHNRQFGCSEFIPSGAGYENVSGTSRICNAVSAVAGQTTIDGDVYIGTAYQYVHSHKWRNFGFLICFLLFFTTTYMIAAETVQAKKAKGELLIFPRSKMTRAKRANKKARDPEAAAIPVPVLNEKSSFGSGGNAKLDTQKAVFHWEDLCYDVPTSDGTLRILDHVDGWVKPGTLTALMGVSGAGKTTLLDVLATRTTTGVVTGDAFVDGLPRDASFQRQTGYVQQQDLHLETATVREALTFSAIVRQTSEYTIKQKIAYVDEVIEMLDMYEYADAVIGAAGEGLNVEQRKRLTIGVELAARPKLLVFFDEPTSGLDSQTSWSICSLMEDLTRRGQAILCTIHQPSAILFQRFDRLLFLAKGGRTVYFGEIGDGSNVLIEYFQRYSGQVCPPDANPAEWMLDVIGATPGHDTDVDWHQAWRSSPEYVGVRAELQRLRDEAKPVSNPTGEAPAEFSAPFVVQLITVTARVFQQYWRTPSYIYAKAFLCIASALFIGFSFFQADNSMQGLQNQMFSVFMLFTLFGQILQQMLPHFVTQRALYEARERPSKAYSWKAFIIAQIVVEIPWNFLMSVAIFFCFYYPIGLQRNAVPTDTVTERGGLFFLLIWMFLLFTSTFADMVIAAAPSAEVAGNIANVLFTLCLVFCGVLATPQNMPGFWIFMYRVSPFTYLASAMLSVGLANTKVVCSTTEILHLDAPDGQTCSEFLQSYADSSDGQLLNPDATGSCELCPISSTNQFLTSINSSYSNRWRDFGLMWVYVVFNISAAIFLYWLVRVPKNKKTTLAPPKQTTDEKKSPGPIVSSPQRSGSGDSQSVVGEKPEQVRPVREMTESQQSLANTHQTPPSTHV